jgi:DNA-binding response OmpR family regulator
MPSKTKQDKRAILLVEADVLIRLALSEHLRGCGFTVLEAAAAEEARAILLAGPAIDILFSDAELGAGESGFALAQWVRRHRPNVRVTLAATIAHKIEAAASLCTHSPRHDAATLEARLRAMLAERARRSRRPASSASPSRKRKLS